VKDFFSLSRYKLLHSLGACLAIAGLFLNKNVWHTFIYGSPTVNPPSSQIFSMMIMQTGYFGVLILILWLTTLFNKKNEIEHQAFTPLFSKGKAVLFSCKWFIPIALIAFATEFISLGIFEKVFNITLPPQDLVRWLQPGIYPDYVRYSLMFMAVIEAPIIEEVLFRSIIFRGLGTKLPLLPALIISGFVFGIVHVNAATLLPLWFLGVAFAWVYWKTQRIIAPITMHFLFNGLNLVLCLFFPELAN
jgi:membrane protease YdiL (CAAX protease family)